MVFWEDSWISRCGDLPNWHSARRWTTLAPIRMPSFVFENDILVWR